MLRDEHKRFFTLVSTFADHLSVQISGKDELARRKYEHVPGYTIYEDMLMTIHLQSIIVMKVDPEDIPDIRRYAESKKIPEATSGQAIRLFLLHRIYGEPKWILDSASLQKVVDESKRVHREGRWPLVRLPDGHFFNSHYLEDATRLLKGSIRMRSKLFGLEDKAALALLSNEDDSVLVYVLSVEDGPCTKGGVAYKEYRNVEEKTEVEEDKSFSGSLFDLF